MPHSLAQASREATQLHEIVLPQTSLSISDGPATRQFHSPGCSSCRTGCWILLVSLFSLVHTSQAAISQLVCLQREGTENFLVQGQGWNNQYFFEKNQCMYGENEYVAIRQALKPILPNAKMRCERLPSPSHTSAMYNCVPKDNIR